MSKRLRLGLLVIAAELGAAAVCLQVSVAAQAPDTPDAVAEATVDEFPLETAFEPGPQTEGTELSNDAGTVASKAQTTVPGGDKQKEAVYESILKDGVVRTMRVYRDAPQGSKASVENLQDTYLTLHRILAERLTPEQLTEKCKALQNELNELDAEIEIQQIQKKLSELKRKNVDNKSISTRVQGAIDSLKNKPAKATGEDFRSL